MKSSLVRRTSLLALLLSSFIAVNGQAQSSMRPAMIVNGSDSVAAKLHYPPKAKASRTEAAIPFYCEVGANGKPDHIQLYGPKNKTEFRTAILAALRSGRFDPAMSAGRAVPVIVGGTVFFIFHDNEPIIAVTLSTADKNKTAALSNYIQPQMLASSAQFRRKIWNARFDPTSTCGPESIPERSEWQT